ncbi:hypothetical protein EP073_04020 [Geovibrio thiophilus]|uniref:Uncharacterized protein n=1 Tax=Geovibrio thiophilus TaxID=139438 RepID=A0A410JX53_9BACT|nr:hypothetical protein [Geovibrio thiophilus]QAR32601.1 hypothetical protein EP073_04020 [Geovibrio thiophilus]
MRLKIIFAVVFTLTAISVFAAAPALPGCETVSVKTGKDAARDIARLHGRDIEFESSYVAEYKCGGDPVIIWASFSKTKNEAKSLFKLMDDKMPTSQAFRNLMRMKTDGFDVAYVTGMGMDNYYFPDGKGNYWLAATGRDTFSILKKLTGTLKQSR